MNARRLPVLTVIIASLAFGAFAQGVTGAFDAANKLYDQGKYSEAADAYLGLIREGNSSVAVYYNLGNALLKAGARGRAIAAYRIVEATTPRDPDLRANLKYAVSQVQGPGIKESYLTSWIKKLTVNEWAVLASIAFAATLILVAAGQVRVSLRKPLYRYGIVAGFAAACLATCLGVSLHETYGVQRAIVISHEAAVRRGPLEEAEPVFTVFDGAELRVMDLKGDWAQIAVSDTKTGWIRLADIKTNARPSKG